MHIKRSPTQYCIAKKKAEECAEQTIMMPLNQTAEYVEIC